MPIAKTKPVASEKRKRGRPRTFHHVRRAAELRAHDRLSWRAIAERLDVHFNTIYRKRAEIQAIIREEGWSEPRLLHNRWIGRLIDQSEEAAA